jgi:riboflavin synthase
MFTGLVEACGIIKKIDRNSDHPISEGCRLQIEAPMSVIEKLSIGASISVQGVCLTVITLDATFFEVECSKETLSVTNFAYFKIGNQVNLETCLTPTTAMGGHWVTGHVDGCGEIIEIQTVGDSKSIECKSIEIRIAKDLSRFVATKGSITVNGVSLTVNSVKHQNFYVNLIPHTLAVTTLKDLKVGDLVNIEVDLIARYAARLIMEQE